MAGEMPGAYFISYFSALGMEPAFLKIYNDEYNQNQYRWRIHYRATPLP